jgi:hypothetical protein
MAKQNINIGVNPNDGTGDVVREAFRKSKENFDELYARPTGDMNKSTYDSDNSGAVDLADKITGVDAAGNVTYYGKDAAGTIGFHTFNAVTEISAASGTGTVLDLSNVLGTNYNYATPSNATSYTIQNPTLNGYAIAKINAPSEPTITGATKINGAAFEANTNMEMVVESKDGTNVRYFFLKL